MKSVSWEIGIFKKGNSLKPLVVCLPLPCFLYYHFLFVTFELVNSFGMLLWVES